MANHHFNAKLVCQLNLNLLLPQPVTAIVTPPSISQDEQTVFTRKAGSVRVSPPLGNGIGSKLRCIEGSANIDISLVMGQVIDTIRYRTSQCILTKIMEVDLLCLLCPTATLIEKVANEFLFLGIDRKSFFTRLM